MIPNNLKSVDFIGESIRARNYCNYRLNPSVDTILASFFLYVYYADIKQRNSQAFIYLREAISIAEMLELYLESDCDDFPEENARFRNIYYMLLITERSTSLTTNLPVVLDVIKPYSMEIDAESQASGFSQIVKVFTVSDKSFFICLSQNHISIPKKIILEIQQRLADINTDNNNIPYSQKLNIILTQNWMKLLMWNMCKDNTKVDIDKDFPLQVARDLLSRTKSLPSFAFEINGTGVCTKLIKIAENVGLAINKDNSSVGCDILRSIFNTITLLKAKIICGDIEQRIQYILQNNAFISMANGRLINSIEANFTGDCEKEHDILENKSDDDLGQHVFVGSNHLQLSDDLFQSSVDSMDSFSFLFTSGDYGVNSIKYRSKQENNSLFNSPCSKDAEEN